MVDVLSDSLLGKLPLIILAGGFGTRIRRVVPDLPKALAPVHGRPFLCYQIENWKRQGIIDFVFSLHHKADQIIQFIEHEEKRLFAGCRVRFCVEPKPMGTGGAVKFTVNELGIEGPILVANADTWCEEPFSDLHEPFDIIGVRHVNDVSRYGTVKFNHEGFVSSFLEKSTNHKRGFVYTGTAKLLTSYFKNYSKETFSLESEILPIVQQSGRLKAHQIETLFIDIGIPTDFERFNKFIKKRLENNNV